MSVATSRQSLAQRSLPASTIQELGLGLTRCRGPIRVKRSGSMNGVEDGQHTQNCPPEFKQGAVRLVWSSEEKHPEDSKNRYFSNSSKASCGWRPSAFLMRSCARPYS